MLGTKLKQHIGMLLAALKVMAIDEVVAPPASSESEAILGESQSVEKSISKLNTESHWLIGIGSSVLALIAGILISSRVWMKRAIEDPTAREIPRRPHQNGTPPNPATEPLDTTQGTSSSTRADTSTPASARAMGCTPPTNYRHERLKRLHQKQIPQRRRVHRVRSEPHCLPGRAPSKRESKEEPRPDDLQGMPTRPSYLQHLKQALDVHHQSFEGLQSALLEFEKALLEFEEAALNEKAAKRPNLQNLRLLSLQEVCQELGTDENSVYQLLRSGEIPSLKLGSTIKVRQADLDEYQKARRSLPEE